MLPFNLERAKRFLDETCTERSSGTSESSAFRRRSYGIVFDKDPDGICSAALIVKYLRSRGVEPSLAHSKDETGINVSDALLDQMNSCERLVTCDLPVDQSATMSKVNVKDWLILDHHVPVKDMNTKRRVHINPRFEDVRTYRPTSYLAYVLTSPFSKKYCWIAGIGILGDYGLKDCKDVIGVIAKMYPQLVTKNPYDQKEMWKSGLGLLAGVLAAAAGVKDYVGATRAMEIVAAAERPEDVTSSELMQYYDEFQKELEHIVDDFEHNAQRFGKPNAYLYNVKSKYKIMSVVSTLVSERHPDSVMLLYRETAHHVELSARCQSGRVDVAKLMQELTRGIGSGGGHDKAAGGEVAIEHKEELLERIRRRFEGLEA